MICKNPGGGNNGLPPPPLETAYGLPGTTMVLSVKSIEKYVQTTTTVLSVKSMDTYVPGANKVLSVNQWINMCQVLLLFYL